MSTSNVTGADEAGRMVLMSPSNVFRGDDKCADRMMNAAGADQPGSDREAMCKRKNRVTAKALMLA